MDPQDCGSSDQIRPGEVTDDAARRSAPSCFDTHGGRPLVISGLNLSSAWLRVSHTVLLTTALDQDTE